MLIEGSGRLRRGKPHERRLALGGREIHLSSAIADTGSPLPGSFRACGSPALSSPECPPLHEDGPVTAQHRPSGSGACLRRLRLSSCVGYGRC